MITIIAEKPSQAKQYAKALGNFTQRNGYLENNIYYITWCFGHLIELEKDTHYRAEGKWSKNYLPLIPEKYAYKIGSDSKGKIDTGKKKQLDIIGALLKNSTQVINGADADREGELIFRYVYNFLKCQLPFKRLWISSLTDGDIQKGFKNLLEPSDVDALSKSAYSRAIADWLVGVNGTQASTLQFGGGTLLPIGRVQTAILKIICERYNRNKSFEKTYTYKIRAEHFIDQQFFSETDTYSTKEEATNVSKTLAAEHLCTKIDKRNVKTPTPLLFSIDTLIIEANKKFKYSGQQTLDTAQSLYEKKITSYPRTDSEYINEENFANMKLFLEGFVQEHLGLTFSFSNEKPRSVNNQKLTGSHDAIVPTGFFAHNLNLSQIEKDIYHLILSRTAQSFSTALIEEKVKYFFSNNNIEFYSTSSRVIELGFTAFVLNKKIESTEEPTIINVIEGESYIVKSFTIKEIESKPPPLYSDVNLTQDLTNVGKMIKDNNPELLSEIKSNIDINSLQIGTQATRPAIIERLKSLDFIVLTKNKYLPTEKGLKYYSLLKNLEISNIVTTAIWEMKLKQIAERKELPGVFYKEIREFTQTIVSDIFSINADNISFAQKKEVLGLCPKCKKGDIVEGKKAFGCSTWKEGCDFVIWKGIAGKNITATAVKHLLQKKETAEIKGFKSKAGKIFSAKLELDKDLKIKFKF